MKTTIINNGSEITITFPVAIIPNAVSSVRERTGRSEEVFDIFARKMAGHNARFGMQMVPSERVVELWWGSEEESYSNGGLPNEIIQALAGYDNSQEREGRFTYDSFGNRTDMMPVYLPVNLFTGKKEGDTLVLVKRGELPHAPRVELRLILNQRDNRYARFGEFHEVLAKLQSASKPEATPARRPSRNVSRLNALINETEQLRSECAASGRS